MKLVKQLIYILVAAVLLGSIIILPSSAEMAEATPSQSPVYINGTQQRLDAYFINGHNYLKIRDIAYAFRGTSKQFQIAYNERTKQIDLTSHTGYTTVGFAMAASNLKRLSAATTDSNVYLDGKPLALKAYFINRTNYVKLRDLAAAIDFGVTYVPLTRAIEIDTSVGYTPDKPAPISASELGVTLIGDSIGVTMAPYLKSYYPKLNADAKVSRQFSEGLGIARNILQAGNMGQVVVIELGANGEIRESQLREMIEMMGSSRKLIFVNVQVPRAWCESDNAVLARVTAEYPNAVIADWYGASINTAVYFCNDGVHPTSAGAAAMAKMIADKIAEITAG